MLSQYEYLVNALISNRAEIRKTNFELQYLLQFYP